MSAYQALLNLSVPRKGDPNKETDLVFAGETIELDDDVAELFLPPRKAFPMIRAVKESGEPLPQFHPKQLSGIAINQRTGKRIGYPGPPEGARPDPPGSTTIQVLEPPEASEPVPGSEDSPAPVDAEDIPPRNAPRQPARTAGKAPPPRRTG
jgi:hypothetical protein